MENNIETKKDLQGKKGPHPNNTSVTPVIGFIDVDAFECQVWQRESPWTRGHPCVVATNTGRILAASYEAKALGINRDATPQLRQAKTKCEHLIVFSKGEKWGKQDQTKVRHATWLIVTCVQKFLKKAFPNVEMKFEVSSSDEMYVDLSAIVSRLIDNFYRKRKKMVVVNGRPIILIPEHVVWERRINTMTGPFDYRLPYLPEIPKNGENSDLLSYGYKNEERLMFGSLFMYDLLATLVKETGFVASGGIAKNMLLAKVGCGLHKPQNITVLYEEAFLRVSKTVSIPSIPGFGGNLGQQIQDSFNIKYVSQIRRIEFLEMQKMFGKEKAQQIFSKAVGQDNSHVKNKITRDQMKCNKPANNITNTNKLRVVIEGLTAEILQILKEEGDRYNRTASEVRVEFKFKNKKEEEGASDVFDLNGKNLELEPRFRKSLISQILEFVEKVPEFDIKSFVITELSFTLRNFKTLQPNADAVDVSGKDAMDLTTLSEALNQTIPLPPILRVNRNMQFPSSTVPKFSEQEIIGTFRITTNMGYSLDGEIPRLLSEEELLRSIPGCKLNNGFDMNKSTKYLIQDYVRYTEAKHQYFGKWLKEEKPKIEGLDDISFITFNGRIIRAFKTLLNQVHGEWEIYAMNVDGIIYIWDEITPRGHTHRFNPAAKYCAIVFENVVTGNTIHLEDGCPDEIEKIFPIQKMRFGKYKMLILNNADALD